MGSTPSHSFYFRTVIWQSMSPMVPSHGSETTATHITNETDARLACCSKFELVVPGRPTVRDRHERYSVSAMEFRTFKSRVDCMAENLVLSMDDRLDEFQYSLDSWGLHNLLG